jgi:hypothetical protein
MGCLQEPGTIPIAIGGKEKKIGSRGIDGFKAAVETISQTRFEKARLTAEHGSYQGMASVMPKRAKNDGLWPLKKSSQKLDLQCPFLNQRFTCVAIAPRRLLR